MIPLRRTPLPPSPALRGLMAASGRALLAAAAIAALVGASAARAQAIQDGALLIASTELKDPNFSRSVVLVLRHDDNGTIGVVVNRLTTLEPAKVFPELAADVGAYTGTLYRGGPVSPARLLFLVRGLAAATVQGPEVVEKVFLTGDAESLPGIARLADGTNELRMYAGHAEWVAGQLQSEIAEGAWRMIPGTADLVFHTAPSRLWEELAGRGGEVVADARIR
jgi:putative transcriptional regulator